VAHLAKTQGSASFDWRLAAYAVVSAMLLFPFAAIASSDEGELLFLLTFGVNGACLAIAACRKRGLRTISLIASLVVYVCASWPLLTDFYDMHVFLRWQLTKNADRAALPAQPSPPNHEFKHLDWDGWGFAGMDTEVYLVYDPADSLDVPAESGRPGKYAGIPCNVFRVRRLESHYFAVQFYTDTGWDACSS
jgi:hypothetical protein